MNGFLLGIFFGANHLRYWTTDFFLATQFIRSRHNSGHHGLWGRRPDLNSESIAIGLGMLDGSGVSTVTVAAIFISNNPEVLSSSAVMKRNGRSAGFIFGVWVAIALVSCLAALAGYSIFDTMSNEVRAATTAVAAGAILAMIADTMIPEAFEETHDLAGLITAAGFLCAFALSKFESGN